MPLPLSGPLFGNDGGGGGSGGPLGRPTGGGGGGGGAAGIAGGGGGAGAAGATGAAAGRLAVSVVIGGDFGDGTTGMDVTFFGTAATGTDLLTCNGP